MYDGEDVRTGALEAALMVAQTHRGIGAALAKVGAAPLSLMPCS